MSHDKYYSSHQIVVGDSHTPLLPSDKKLKLSASGDLELYTGSDILITSTNLSVLSNSINTTSVLNLSGGLNCNNSLFEYRYSYGATPLDIKYYLSDSAGRWGLTAPFSANSFAARYNVSNSYLSFNHTALLNVSWTRDLNDIIGGYNQEVTTKDLIEIKNIGVTLDSTSGGIKFELIEQDRVSNSETLLKAFPASGFLSGSLTPYTHSFVTPPVINLSAKRYYVKVTVDTTLSKLASIKDFYITLSKYAVE